MGHSGEVREHLTTRDVLTVHETAVELLRLLVANHPFVDGNKRTALASAVTFCAIKGHELRSDGALKGFPVRLATDQQSVDSATVRAYLEERTRELAEESGP
jgi:death-on-curing protein